MTTPLPPGRIRPADCSGAYHCPATTHTDDCYARLRWLNRQPAPWPTPDEQAVIDRFGIFDQDQP